MSSEDADLSCPYGGHFYACSTGSLFLGCCKSDPCSGGCAGDDLTAASFNATYTGRFPDQNCTNGAFYTCSHIDTAFIGCCRTNPCQNNGCLSGNLVPARLSNADAASSFPTSTSSASSTSKTLMSASSTLSKVSSATSSAIPSSISNFPQGTDRGLSRGAIAGIAVGGLIALLAVAAIIAALCTRRDKRYTTAEKEGFTGRGRNGQNDDYDNGSPGHAELAAPMLALGGHVKVVPQASIVSTPHESAVVSTPSTTLNTGSPGVSSLSPNSNTGADRWSAAHSAVSELAGSEAYVHHNPTWTELACSDAIHGTYQVQGSSLLETNNPYNSPSMYAAGVPRYQAYRPS